jgi:hypothetical protein
VAIIGALIYMFILVLLRSEDVYTIFGLFRRIKLGKVSVNIPKKETEPVSPSQSDSEI